MRILDRLLTYPIRFGLLVGSVVWVLLTVVGVL